MRKLTVYLTLLFVGLVALVGCGGKSDDAATPPTTTTDNAVPKPDTAAGGAGLTIAWAQWKPSDYLQELAKDFTAETKIPVTVEQIDWKDYQNKIQTGVWTGKSDKFDIIIGDSQWLGRGATEGHYVDLTDWAKTNVPWSEIPTSAKTFYCDYDGKTYAVPCEVDAIGFAYRKDLFEDPKEKAAFKAKYKRDLAPPTTWAELKDVAEFFTRPAQNLSGVAVFYAGGGGYDGITMGFMQTLWCLGGDLHDPSGKVQGIINSPASVAALKFYAQDLKQFTPKGSENYYYDECLKAFQTGQVAMAMDWYTFFPGLTDKAKNPLADKTGFFVSPSGPAGHFISLGGQGMSISSYSKNQENAKQFLAWFSKREAQQKWAKLGGLTANTAVLQTSDFKDAAPFNPAFAESVQYLRDFYNTPQYAELLDSTQTHWNAVVSGSETPQAASDAIALKHTDILKEASAK